MVPPNITTLLATEEDGPALASLMTICFVASDAAYPLIWGGAAEGAHDSASQKALLSPVQTEARVTFKAMDGQKLVGFATWSFVQPKKEGGEAGEKKEPPKRPGLPQIPGVNTELLVEKMVGRRFFEGNVDPEKDFLLTLLFVNPDYQRQGIGSLLMQWGLKKADESGAKLWLTSTPKGVSTYEKHGWKVVERVELDLGKYGGDGIYVRSWMGREPRAMV